MISTATNPPANPLTNDLQTPPKNPPANGYEPPYAHSPPYPQGFVALPLGGSTVERRRTAGAGRAHCLPARFLASASKDNHG
jgi:hypothetical protein